MPTIIIVAMFAAFVVACGAQRSSDAIDVPEWIHEVDPAINRAVWVSMAEPQKSLLERGPLGRDTYAEAVDGYLTCLEEVGHGIDRPDNSSNGLRITWTIRPNPAVSEGRYASQRAECDDRHTSYVHRLWQRLHPPTTDEQQTAGESIELCLKSAGYAPPPGGSGEYRDWVGPRQAAWQSGEFVRCAISTLAATGVDLREPVSS